MASFVESLPQVDGRPRRALACMNVRYEEKRVVDHLQTWWSLRAGRDFSQCDVFSILLAAALRSGLVDAPRELLEAEVARAGP